MRRELGTSQSGRAHDHFRRLGFRGFPGRFLIPGSVEKIDYPKNSLGYDKRSIIDVYGNVIMGHVTCLLYSLIVYSHGILI